MSVVLETFELSNIIAKASEYGARRALEQTGAIKPRLSLSEAYRLASRVEVDRAIKERSLKVVKKGGKTSKKYILRSDFDSWLMRNEIIERVKPTIQ